MIAMRLAKAASKKSREAGKKHANAAIKMAPTAVSYVALGTVLSRPAADMSKLKQHARGGAIDAIRTALRLSDEANDEAAHSKSRKGRSKGRGAALDTEREAETRVTLANLLTTQPKPPTAAVEEGLALIRRAEALQPSNPRYAEARQQLEQGVERYQAQLQSYNAEQAKQRQRELEAAEEAESAEDEFAEEW